MQFNPLTIVMVLVLVLLVFFMFRNSRKRQRDQQEMRTKMVPGAEVMTNFGLFGTLLSVNEDDNTALIETSPGTVVKVHRQVLARVVEPSASETTEDTAALSDAEPTSDASATESDESEPQYGERIRKDDAPKTDSSASSPSSNEN